MEGKVCMCIHVVRYEAVIYKYYYNYAYKLYVIERLLHTYSLVQEQLQHHFEMKIGILYYSRGNLEQASLQHVCTYCIRVMVVT